MKPEVDFPTARHQAVTERVLSCLTADPRVDAVCFTASLAQGYADPVSDLDFSVFTASEHVSSLSEKCAELASAIDREDEMWVDIDASDGNFTPKEMGWADLDRFELEIGNMVIYAIPAYERNDAFRAIRKKWSPYYDEALATKRGARFAHLTTNHCVQGMKSVRRDFALDALDRLQMGVQTFVAGLFVSRRTYPVDYMKRIDRHLEVLLHESTLGRELRELFNVNALEPARMTESFRRLDSFARDYLKAEGPSAFA